MQNQRDRAVTAESCECAEALTQDILAFRQLLEINKARALQLAQIETKTDLRYRHPAYGPHFC